MAGRGIKSAARSGVESVAEAESGARPGVTMVVKNVRKRVGEGKKDSKAVRGTRGGGSGF